MSPKGAEKFFSPFHFFARERRDAAIRRTRDFHYCPWVAASWRVHLHLPLFGRTLFASALISRLRGELIWTVSVKAEQLFCEKKECRSVPKSFISCGETEAHTTTILPPFSSNVLSLTEQGAAIEWTIDCVKSPLVAIDARYTQPKAHI